MLKKSPNFVRFGLAADIIVSHLAVAPPGFGLFICILLPSYCYGIVAPVCLSVSYYYGSSPYAGANLSICGGVGLGLIWII